MSYIITPSYKDLFPTGNKSCPKDLIKDIPTSVILQLIAWLGSIMHIHPFNFEKTEYYFLHWLGAFPEKEKVRLFNLYNNRKQQEPEKAVTVFTQVRNLHFINFCIKNYKEGGRTLSEPNSVIKSEEINILKAYLIIADENEADASKPIADSRNYSGFDKFYISFWPVFINQFAFESRKSFVIQSIQSFMFFQFAEKSDDFKNYIKEFYKDINIDNGSTYIYHIWDAYIALLNKENPSFRIKVIPNEGLYNLLNRISINEPYINSNITIAEKDFTSLRNKPVFKVSHDEFCILNHNFFIDKIYEGIKFDFYHQAQENNYLGTFNSRFKKFGDFKSVYSDIFSEKSMFYKLMDYSFKKFKYWVKVNGSMYNEEYSDYYIRNGNKIFLFEFKAIIVKSMIKFSGDGLKIRNEIDRQLIMDGKQKKGISQLADIIKKIDEKPFNFDDFHKKKIKSKNISIYPILVLTDDMFDFPGINNYLNDKLKNILDDFSLELQVKDLLLINLNSLFDIHALLKNKKISFDNLINSFLSSSKTKKQKINNVFDVFETVKALEGFSVYLNHYIKSNNLKPSKENDLFNDLVKIVLNEK